MKNLFKRGFVHGKQVIIKYRLLKTAEVGFILLFLAAGTMTHQEEVKESMETVYFSMDRNGTGIFWRMSKQLYRWGKTITRKGISVTIHEVAADKNDSWWFFCYFWFRKTRTSFAGQTLINKQEIQWAKAIPCFFRKMGRRRKEVSIYDRRQYFCQWGSRCNNKCAYSFARGDTKIDEKFKVRRVCFWI